MISSIENLEKELKSGNLRNLYLLYGEERFLLETSLKKIKDLFGECIKGINYILIDDTNINELISNIETPAFGYEKKMIIAKNTGFAKKEGKRKNAQITELKNKICKYINDNINIGTVCKFEYQKPIQITKRLKGICSAYKVKVQDSTIQYLIECCGTNMQDLINETRKLIEYTGEGGEIQISAVDKLATKKIESIIFELTDNLGKKEIEKSLEVLRNLIYTKEPLQKILITLYNHFKKLYFVKIALRNQKDITQSLNLKPNQTFLVTKYKNQSRYFTENELKNILQNFRDLDYNYKNGLIDLQIGLESILCKYCSKD